MLRVCLETKDAWLDGKPLDLPPIRWALLERLVRYGRRGLTTPRDVLVEVWNETEALKDDYALLQCTITLLRKQLGQGSIVNRIGIGYRLTIPVEIMEVDSIVKGER